MSEGVIKSGHREPFTVLYKSAIRDTRLSFEMLGFLTYMLDKPPDWEFTISGMAKERGVGLAQVRRLVGLLEKAGYLLREQAHDDGGKFAKNVYVLQEKPPLSRNQYDGEPLKSPLSGNADIGETRQREKPLSVSATQSKNVETKAYNNPPYNPPKGDEKSPKSPKVPRRSDPREAPDWNPERFAKFWEAYPHKFRGNKQAAMDMWDRLHADDELLNEISHCLLILTRSSSWKAEIGIPHAKTFLNPRNERWKDAYDVEKDQEHSATIKAQPVRRIEQPPDSQDGGWTWAE
ncbi:MAG: hypothetical protein ACLSS5_08740 [Oscillibacter sp.]